MQIIDAGHIYKLDTPPFYLTFVKRGGGAIQYPKEWPGIQTQAVMRAIIHHLHGLINDPTEEGIYPLWQLGSSESQPLYLSNRRQISNVIDILIDRSRYLNNILNCVETMDACGWLTFAMLELQEEYDEEYDQAILNAIHAVRMALWNYEARAYRRKQESVNREHPAHDDSVRPRSWREFPCDDVPFNEKEIEDRPIGDDGHIVLAEKELIT